MEKKGEMTDFTPEYPQLSKFHEVPKQLLLEEKHTNFVPGNLFTVEKGSPFLDDAQHFHHYASTRDYYSSSEYINRYTFVVCCVLP